MTEIFILNVMPLSRVLFANGLIYFLYNCYLCLNAMQWSLLPYKSFMKWVSLRIVLPNRQIWFTSQQRDFICLDMLVLIWTDLVLIPAIKSLLQIEFGGLSS